jgi:hypothetical protein
MSRTIPLLMLCAALVGGPAWAQSPEGEAQTAEQKAAAAAEGAGQSAAAAWLALLDAGRFGDAWDTASTLFRSNVPKDAFVKGMSGSRSALGAAKERKVGDIAYKTQLQGLPPGQYVSVLFVSDFPGKPATDEIVMTMRENDGRWRVTGYSTR